MFVKTKRTSGRTYYCLCIPERGGHGGDSVKVIEHTLYLGPSLALSADRWLELLRESNVFRRIPLEDVLATVETYVRRNGLPADAIAGLRDAVRDPAQRKSGKRASQPKEPETEYAAALKLLGVPPGSSDRAIESAFRRSARRHHPDVGGDPAKFRALLAARDLLLGRLTSSATDATIRREYNS